MCFALVGSAGCRLNQSHLAVALFTGHGVSGLPAGSLRQRHRSARLLAVPGRLRDPAARTAVLRQVFRGKQRLHGRIFVLPGASLFRVCRTACSAIVARLLCFLVHVYSRFLLILRLNRGSCFSAGWSGLLQGTLRSLPGRRGVPAVRCWPVQVRSCSLCCTVCFVGCRRGCLNACLRSMDSLSFS